jgi:thiol-disulfide isomerase/thioredoxin
MTIRAGSFPGAALMLISMARKKSVSFRPMRLLIFALFFMCSLPLAAQNGYELNFTITGLRDTTVYLGYFLQDQTWVKDTARVDNRGAFSFSGAKKLPQGLYFLVLDKSRIFDLVVGHDQEFRMETSTEDYVQNMQITGDEDNSIFYENMRFSYKVNKEAEPFVKIARDSTLKEDEKKAARETLTKLNQNMIAHQESVIDRYPSSLTARMMKMNKPINVPDPPKKANGNIDSTFQLRYYRQHYFDHFDLADEAMLRMPKVQYWNKVKDYLDKLFIQHPDTITKAINGLVAVAKKNKDTYRYLVWNCIVNYQNPEIMGLDEVYVNLFDRYIASGEMDYWLDKKTIQNMRTYANNVKKGLIGRPAANLIMQNENLQQRSLFDIKNKYTIVFFFKPSCSHCREETPKLVEFYKSSKKKFDFEVFAVSTDTAMKEMRDFIKEMKTPWITVNGPRSYTKTHFMELYYAETTPTIYILDNKKKIIARKLGVEQLEGFFTNYEKMIKKAVP